MIAKDLDDGKDYARKDCFTHHWLEVAQRNLAHKVQSLEANWRGATEALRQMKGAESKAAFAAGIATQCRTKLSEMGK